MSPKLFLFIPLALLLGAAESSHAQTAEGLRLAAERGAFPKPPYDRSDPAMIVLTAMNGRCGKSRDRGTYRGRVLLRETQQLVEAVENGGDADAAAARLARSIRSSSMFQSCWSTILKNSRVNMTIYSGSF